MDESENACQDSYFSCSGATADDDLIILDVESEETFYGQFILLGFVLFFVIMTVNEIY
jgi:hypothetical protein